MSGISSVLNIGTQALLVDQTVLTTINHNIANANTPGYSKQDVVIGIQSPGSSQGGFVGRGTLVSSIKRSYDKFLVAQEMGQGQNLGKSAVLDQAMSQIEQVYNEAKGLGLSTQLNEYFNAWNDVAANPESQAQRTVLLQKANAMVVAAQTMERSAADTLKYTNLKIDDITNQVNTMATNIAKLNGKIVEAEAGLSAQKANDYRDQRDNLMQELSKLTNVTSYETNTGSLTVMIGMRNLVEGESTSPISSKVNGDGNRDLYLQNVNITSRVTGGELGGLMAARNDIEANALKGLRKLVAAVTNETNKLHSTGFGLDGTTTNDFFNNLTVATRNRDNSKAGVTSAVVADKTLIKYNEYEVRFTAPGAYDIYNVDTGVNVVTGAGYASGGVINFDGMDVVITDTTGTPAAGDRFMISPVGNAVSGAGVLLTDTNKIAASSSAIALPGDNTNALALTKLMSTNMADLGSATFSDYYRGLVATIGSSARSAADSNKFDDNLMNEMRKQREAVSGVSLDEEAANLIRFQRSYQAAAKMITVADELLQSVLNMK